MENVEFFGFSSEAKTVACGGQNRLTGEDAVSQRTSFRSKGAEPGHIFPERKIGVCRAVVLPKISLPVEAPDGSDFVAKQVHIIDEVFLRWWHLPLPRSAAKDDVPARLQTGYSS